MPSCFPKAPPPSGERLTFEAIYKEHGRYIRSMVERQVRRRDVPDLVQQCFFAIHRSLPNYDAALPLKPWIITIVRRTIRDYLERASTRNELLLSGGGVVRDFGPSTEDQLGTRTLLDNLLSPLTERERTMILRHLCDKTPIEEIAADLQLTRDGGYKLLQRAQAKIKEAIRRHQARERRLLGESSMFAAAALQARAWSGRAGSALGRAFATVKAASASLGAGVGLALVLGAVVPPDPGPSARGDAKIALAVIAAPFAPMASNAQALARSAAALLPASSPKSAARPSPGVAQASDALAEQRFLDRIETILETDPAAALAALALHKNTFPREHLRTDRKRIEALAQGKVEAQQHARLGAAPL